jgi:putative transposase
LITIKMASRERPRLPSPRGAAGGHPAGSAPALELDFVSDALNDGRRFRGLNIVDDFTRVCLVAVVDASLSGARVVRELNETIARRGRPCMIVSDDGTELVSRDPRLLPGGAIEWPYITPGKPIQNAFVESFMYGRRPRCKWALVIERPRRARQ